MHPQAALFALFGIDLEDLLSLKIVLLTYDLQTLMEQPDAGSE